MQIPLFPLNTVLFPGGPLPLRIFEVRYLDMISRCMKDDEPFGVLLIREGQEAGRATTFDVGTLARIVDWYQGSDGLLGVTAVGSQRFRVVSTHRREDGLNVGEVTAIATPASMCIPAEFRHLPHVLETILNDLGRLYENLDRRFDDAVWVAWRFAEILPIELEKKQAILETDDIIACLQDVERVFHSR